MLINNKKISNLDEIFPIGSVVIRTDNTSPASLYGGTWEQLKDKFLLGAGDIYSVGSTGGEATHTLTINEMPSHDHQLYTGTSGVTGNIQSANTTRIETQQPDWFIETTTTGSSQAHNNMPPYLVVNIWKRYE